MTNEITYFFDADARIERLLIAAAGERPPGSTESEPPLVGFRPGPEVPRLAGLVGLALAVARRHPGVARPNPEAT